MTDLVPVSSGEAGNALEVARAKSVVLKDYVSSTGLVKQIQGRPYVLVEGWTFLATQIMGVSVVMAWSRPVASEVGYGWEARAEVVDADGRLIGSAEAMALHEEQDTARRRSWSATDHGMRSMAQTRAVGKALRLRFGWLMQLAGYQAEPPPDDSDEPEGGPSERRMAERTGTELAEARRQEVRDRFRAIGITDAEIIGKIMADLGAGYWRALANESVWTRVQADLQVREAAHAAAAAAEPDAGAPAPDEGGEAGSPDPPPSDPQETLA